ncbi:hypothetical protein BG006_006463 [Podila minutissima]|uniref:Uncharacterized protein n=1 Tax=Podila minutissima TaxID=64525 RepID=A0A9P5SMI9_9FUNG|nr:hypothetical protein BG006_006463 [Podila minutissima]
MARLVQVISEHPGLKRVKYYSNDRKISEYMSIGMLQAIPPCQEEFKNNWVIHVQDEADGFDSKDEHLVLPEQGWPMHRSLKSIVFDTTLAGYEKTVLIPFLRHCPQLQKLQPSTEIPESAAKALFHLNELRVKYQPLKSVISSLILGCRRLNIFTTDHGCTMGPAVMAALTCHSKFLFVNVLEIKDMVSSEWACQESLESLDVYVGLDYGEQGQDIEVRRAMVRKAYQQLERLTNLQGLKVDFDMKVATGMDEMKNMKALRCLQVGGMAHRMGKAEVVWINDNWPLLDSTAGLWTWQGEEIDEVADEELYEAKQDAIDWLLEQRPEFTEW